MWCILWFRCCGLCIGRLVEGWMSDNKVSMISMPATACSVVEAALIASTARLPSSMCSSLGMNVSIVTGISTSLLMMIIFLYMFWFCEIFTCMYGNNNIDLWLWCHTDVASGNRCKWQTCESTYRHVWTNTNLYHHWNLKSGLAYPAHSMAMWNTMNELLAWLFHSKVSYCLIVN